MTLKHIILISVAISCISGCNISSVVENNSNYPNIILFYVDDLGYGDVGVYGAEGVSTPHIDRLAKGGIKFTDAHCSAATCTPSRYSLLTGNYAFRNNAAILPGDAPLLIDTSQQTLPKLLQSAGYKTGIVGKWHLGLGYGQIDWNQKITPGANEVGFDYSFLLPATGDRVPTVFVENGHVVNLDPNDPINVSYSTRIDSSAIGLEVPETLKQLADTQHSQTIVNGVSRIGYMTGGESTRWVDEDFPYTFNEKVTDFIQGSKEGPFFLMYSFHDIHVPRVPHKNFIGSSEMGPRGDAIVQVDFAVGYVTHLLDSLGLLDNTLLLFTSDNGPVLDDGYQDQAVEKIGDHDPLGGFRGGKYSAYEAGTRVPTIAYWKGKIQPLESNALVSQIDLLASLAALTGQDVSDSVIDSQNQLEAWLGKTTQGRDFMLEEAFTLALRKGDFKYIRPFKGTTPDWLNNKDIENGLSSVPQLYDLSKDIREQNNLSASMPGKVQELDDLITQITQK